MFVEKDKLKEVKNIDALHPQEHDVTLFAETNFRSRRVKFGIKRDDRRRHMYLLGKTGTGKSTMMENMIMADINNGEGVALVDPHGDFAEKILDFIPSWRMNDVIYFNPADMAFPVAFNPLESVDEAQKHLIASGVVGVFKKMFAESWGPRLEYLLRNAVLALLEYPGSTLLGIMRILVDKGYRSKVLSKVKDPVVKSFWVNEYAKYPDRFQVEAVSPIQNKVGQFLSNFLIRNIVGQVKSTINMREIMDGRKILLMNLAKGRIGEDTSAALGALLITKIQLAAMERVDIPEKERKDFYLYVDEFQNFATDSFATILSEARKYRLNLVMGHQYIEQLDEKVAASVFGNVGTIACFRIGPADAEKLVTEFAPIFTEEDLVNLKKYDIYLRLMIDGVASNPFSATGLPPLSPEQKVGNAQKIIKISRERYATPREVIEDKISRWSGGDEESVSDEGSSSDFRQQVKSKVLRSADSSSRTANTPMFKAICNRCGKATEVAFEPDGVRPVYCKDCLKIIREDKKFKEERGLVQPPPAVKSISLAQAKTLPPITFTDKKEEPRLSPRPTLGFKSSPVIPVPPLPPPSAKRSADPANLTPEAKAKPLLPGQVAKF